MLPLCPVVVGTKKEWVVSRSRTPDGGGATLVESPPPCSIASCAILQLFDSLATKPSSQPSRWLPRNSFRDACRSAMHTRVGPMGSLVAEGDLQLALAATVMTHTTQSPSNPPMIQFLRLKLSGRPIYFGSVHDFISGLFEFTPQV